MTNSELTDEITRVLKRIEHFEQSSKKVIKENDRLITTIRMGELRAIVEIRIEKDNSVYAENERRIIKQN